MHCLRSTRARAFGNVRWDSWCLASASKRRCCRVFVCKLKQLFSIEMAKWIHIGVWKSSVSWAWHTISMRDFEFINSDKNEFACNFIDSSRCLPSIEIISAVRCHCRLSAASRQQCSCSSMADCKCKTCALCTATEFSSSWIIDSLFSIDVYQPRHESRADTQIWLWATKMINGFEKRSGRTASYVCWILLCRCRGRPSDSFSISLHLFDAEKR